MDHPPGDRPPENPARSSSGEKTPQDTPGHDESLDRLLVHVCRLHYVRAHALLEEIGLYRGQPPLLEALWQQEGRTHSELAALLHIHPATVTKMIQRMEQAGFVERRRDPQDQRVSRVYLTQAGRDIRQQVRAIQRQMEADAFAGLEPAEREQIRRLLERVRDNLARLASL
ncbi:MarR family transcriptional regulator [Litorilinea aerophila]|uniref:MarR family transcriptional regulator n=1 Tax=Litorilinea aerophila TaxID=1204385 RepID=A0A540VFX9_9CHLR|nr:MarR family transcriptional regulator [Litorilinea aerophila]MCC9076671.1 MarR family transcriptional regulator [Litorilinea aerophila]